MYCGTCTAPRLARDPTTCENYHTWDESAALDAAGVLARRKERLADVEKQLAELDQWGAAVSVLSTEAKGLRSSIVFWEKKVKEESKQ